jgi:lipid II:glycine glycyltransferase (peptidoglycan interpeptide bridge formation enzyme)
LNTFLRGLAPSNPDSCKQAASFLQSWFWGSFKARFGWNVFSFEVQWNTPSSYAPSPLLVMHRRIAPGLSFAYVGWGPELPADFPLDSGERTKALSELASALRHYLPKSAAFIRFDPSWYSVGKDAEAPSLGKPFARSAADVQAPDTVILNLNLSEEEVLSNMKKQWLYNRRMALNRGLVISRPDEAGVDVFYALLKTTAGRTGIAIHGIDYYKTLFAHCRDYRQGEEKCAEDAVPRAEDSPPELRLYLAEHEGIALAAMIVLYWGVQAVYLYAASSDHKRNLMPSFALKIQAILDARSAGCTEYDLFGIPPNEDPSHPMAGLYRFKTGFGGKIIHRPGSWDYLYRPLAARLFRKAESLRKSLRDRKKAKPHTGGNLAYKPAEKPK